MVGYFLAKRWHLPDAIAEAVHYHHDYAALARPDGLSDAARSLIALGAFAEHISRINGPGNGDEEWGKAAPAACAYFNLSLGAVDDLIEDIRDWLD